jgi:hypothetical protein
LPGTATLEASAMNSQFMALLTVTAEKPAFHAISARASADPPNR